MKRRLSQPKGFHASAFENDMLNQILGLIAFRGN